MIKDNRLTKAETVALWHAVDWMDLCLREQAESPALEAERARLKLAKQALRKVNRIRKGQAPEPRRASIGEPK